MFNSKLLILMFSNKKAFSCCWKVRFVWSTITSLTWIWLPHDGSLWSRRFIKRSSPYLIENPVMFTYIILQHCSSILWIAKAFCLYYSNLSSVNITDHGKPSNLAFFCAPVKHLLRAEFEEGWFGIGVGT